MGRTPEIAESSRNPLIDSIADWLINQALADAPIHDLFEKTCMQLHAAGIPITRAQVGFRVLHPLFDAQTLTWKKGQEVELANYLSNRDASQWEASPLYHMVVNDIPHLRRHLVGEEAIVDFEIIKVLRDEGYTDYIAFLIAFGMDEELKKDGKNSGLVGSWATDRPSGFSESDIRSLHRIEQRLAVALKINIQQQITANILSAYLGPDAGRQVLNGSIQRGDGETIKAVIWYSDMRGSTPMANSMTAMEFLQALNCYFESTAGAVLANGGEVLRFIGDAVLAIFPIRNKRSTARSCDAAMSAAMDAWRNIVDANVIRRQKGEVELDFGLGLHIGEVLYGNIGVPERVEFSVIGRAANEVARIESLTKEVGERILVSEEFANYVDCNWRDAGTHSLRGVDSDMHIYSPPLQVLGEMPHCD